MTKTVTIEETVALEFGVQTRTVKQRWLTWLDKACQMAGITTDDLDDAVYEAMLTDYGKHFGNGENTSRSLRREWSQRWGAKLKSTLPKPKVEVVEPDEVLLSAESALANRAKAELTVRERVHAMQDEIEILMDRYEVSENALIGMLQGIQSHAQIMGAVLESQYELEVTRAGLAGAERGLRRGVANVAEILAAKNADAVS